MRLSRGRERLLRRIAVRRGREAEGVVLLEGPRVVATALDLGAEISFVVLEEGTSAERFPDLLASVQGKGIEVIEAPAALLRELSDTETPQGVLAVAREPRSELPPAADAAQERCLVLDAVADPGNVGTLARTAAGLGAGRLLALDGTADPWGAKAVRASAGFVFALPVHPVGWDDARAWLEASGLPLLVADGGGRDVRDWLRSSAPGATGAGWALLVGNEGSGPRPEALEAAAARLRIPVSSAVESLNASVAGSLLLWALGPGRDRPEAGP